MKHDISYILLFGEIKGGLLRLRFKVREALKITYRGFHGSWLLKGFRKYSCLSHKESHGANVIGFNLRER